MCDTFATRTEDGVLLAKNSDRDPNEAQTLRWYAAADHPPGSLLRVTWSTLEQVAHTHAIAVSQPWWMWGAEMGANEHGVTIGNEAVFTRRSGRARRTGSELLGMDLLRLALERSTTREEAVQVIVTLLERHGQGGSCSHEHPRFSYHNSFLVADPAGVVVLETAGRHWATEDVAGRGRSISNGLTIAGFAERYADPVRGRVAQLRRTPRADHRQRGVRRRGGRHDRRAPRPRRSDPVVVPGQRCAERPLRACGRPGHLDPEHGFLGRRPAWHPAALGHGHLGPLHRPVPPDHGGPAAGRGRHGEPVRRGLGVVAPRAAAPGRAEGPRAGPGALS